MTLHRTIAVLLLGVAAWTAAPTELAAQGTDTLVERVRFCTGPLICFGHTQSEYRAWADNNVAPEKQKETFISRYVEPPRGSVEHLVLLSAGQQFNDGAGFVNFLTGHPANFKGAFGRRDEERWMTISRRSIAFRLFDEGHRDAADTFAALAFDARFNHDFTLNNKAEIADAYYEWLQSKYFAANLKSVYLAGHSRGGALMLHLAERFRRDFPDVPLVVHLFDPVLNRRQGELGVQDNRLANPLNPEFESFDLDFRRFFRNQNRLLVYSFVSGDPTTFNLFGGEVFDTARSAAHQTGLDEQDEIFDLGWFRQQYTALGHDATAANTGLIDDALDHLANRGGPVLQAYCDSRPPEVRCNVSPLLSFEDFTTATFDAFGSTSQSGAPLTSYTWRFTGSSIQVGSPPSGTGAGPHSVSFWRVGSTSNLIGTVTVTDSNGNTASASCTANAQAAGGCDGFERCIE